MNIEIENGIAVAKDVEVTGEVFELKKYCEDNNIEEYVAITHSGKRYGVIEGEVKELSEDETAINDKFVLPTEEDIAEEVAENLVEETTEEVAVEPVEEEKVEESVAETTENEPSEEEVVDAVFSTMEELEKEVEELEAKNIELADRIADKDKLIAHLNDQIDTLTVENETLKLNATAGTTHLIALEDVVEFLKNHGLTSISIKE